MGSDTTTRPPAPAGADPLAVCTLPADGLGERLAWIRAEILPHAVSSERLPDGIAWQLEDAPGVAAKLDRLVALERECCSGLVFEHAAGVAGGPRLEVRGIDPKAPVFASLQRAGSGAPAQAALGPRLARAAGFGALVSLLVCCAVPIGAAALFGAAVAAPIATLDQPAVIAGAALVFGGAAFAWQGRRRATSAACGPDC